jgi:hypothetical protein
MKITAKIYFIILYTLIAVIILFLPLREQLQHPDCTWKISRYIFSILIHHSYRMDISSIVFLVGYTVFFTPVIVVLLESKIKYQHRLIWGLFFILYSFVMGYSTFGFIISEKYAFCVSHSHNKLFTILILLDFACAFFTLYMGLSILTRRK